jgi:gliding motility-associated-like protein
MKIVTLIIFSLFFGLIYPLESLAQNQSSKTGKEFWVGFMENSSTPLRLELHITTSNPSIIQIQVPVLGNINFSLASSKDTIINLPIVQTYVMGSENVVKRGVYIKSSEAIQVIALNNAPFSSDAVSITPLEYIPKGGRYIINTFRGSLAFPSQFMVVASEDSTLIEITPAAITRLNKPAATPFTVMLMRGDVYQVQSGDSSSMSGTKIRVANGCKKVVVYSGARCSQVNYNAGCSGCDHLWSQELPTNTWGKEFVTLPVHEMNNGFVISITASKDNTNILVNGIFVVTLNEAENQIINYNSNNVQCITASEPVSVNQLIKSGECNGHPQSLSDPSMFKLIPSEQWVKEVFFRMPTTNNLGNRFLAVLSQNLSDILINGIPLNTQTGVVIRNACAGKEFATLSIPPNSSFRLRSKNPFYAYVYAYGNAESYVTDISGASENLELNFNHNPEDFKYCNLAQLFQFTAINNENYQNLRWDFDDGNTSTGNNTSHTFNASGKFTVKLMGVRSETDCEEDTVSKIITIHEPPELFLGNDTVICNQPEFLASPITNNKYDFLWQNGSNAKLLLISSSTKIILTVTDSNGCSKTDSMMVEFSDCIEKLLYIPNVFTPGKDGLNDKFGIVMQKFADAQCVIYNRWGLELYRFDPMNDLPWNGGVANDADNPCPDGTYYFILNYTDPETEISYTKSGTLLLIREK